MKSITESDPDCHFLISRYGAKLRGNVLIDGKKRQKWYRHIMVYIPQQDELIPILTVKESVLYSGRLRLPWYYSKGRRVHKMYDVLEELKIDHVADSQVGGACDIRGISGGERRRVSIGMGLVADPKIMILMNISYNKIRFLDNEKKLDQLETWRPVP